MSRLFLGGESDDLVSDGEMTVTYGHVKTCFTRLHAHMHATPRECTQGNLTLNAATCYKPVALY